MFLVIKMYPREGQDSNMTNRTHTEAGTGKGDQLLNPTPIFHQLWTSMRSHLPWFLHSVSPSDPLWLHSLPYWARTPWSSFQPASCQNLQFPRSFAFCHVPPPSPDHLQLCGPPSNSSSLCLAPLEPSAAGESHYPTDGCCDRVRFADLSWSLHTIFDPFFSGPSPTHPRVPKSCPLQRAVLSIFLISFPLTPRDGLCYVPYGSPHQADQWSHTESELRIVW